MVCGFLWVVIYLPSSLIVVVVSVLVFRQIRLYFYLFELAVKDVNCQTCGTTYPSSSHYVHSLGVENLNKQLYKYCCGLGQTHQDGSDINYTCIACHKLEILRINAHSQIKLDFYLFPRFENDLILLVLMKYDVSSMT